MSASEQEHDEGPPEEQKDINEIELLGFICCQVFSEVEIERLLMKVAIYSQFV